MRTQKRLIGDIGEELACRFLVKHGFSVIEKNYLRKWGEIDIVGEKDGSFHFIEVKTLQARDVSRETLRQGSGHASYNPADNVHPGKLKRLYRAIETYLLDKNISEDTEWQLDVVTVRLDLGGKEARVEILENVVS